MNSIIEEILHELGVICRDIAVGVIGGVVVLSTLNTDYLWYSLIAGIFMAVGLALELIFKDRGYLHEQSPSLRKANNKRQKTCGFYDENEPK